ncbi:MAG: hypothetical protein HY287_14030 [Planctomycetes bacterium]|nr:hypothetical protein [Planctomycetota bacterium]MBI3835441.1 hypothetical protein [Planctomycetota bacterium]
MPQQLVSAGFNVAQGEFVIFEAADCATLPHCWSNNPTSPYGFFLTPLGDGEPDPDPQNIGPGSPKLRSMFRFQPDEAIVFIGVTPPQSPYYSFTPYVFSRFDPTSTGSPPYDDRVETYASLGDSLNQLVLNTSAGRDEDSFSKETVVIVATDEGVDRAIRAALVRSGFPDAMINTLVLPRFEADGLTSKIFLGYENEADLFNILIRIANPDALTPGTPIRAWLDDPEGYVFRVRPQKRPTLQPFPLPARRLQGTGATEDGSTLNHLVQAIQLSFPVLMTDVKIGVPSVHENGDLCLQQMIPCFADCHDTPYLGTVEKLGPPPDAIIVAGINYELDNQAEYVNITVTRISDQTAFYSVVMRDLIGSADEYIPNDPDRGSVWQVKFSRNCRGEPFCFEVTQDQVPSNEWMTIVVRAYLQPATQTSPKALPAQDSEIIYPRVIKVHN